MKYFLDTEFIEDGKTIDLISIGIVAEDGRRYYAINRDCDFSKASQWVKDNVINQLPPKDPLPIEASPRIWEESKAWKDKQVIAAGVAEFLGCKYTITTPIRSGLLGIFDKLLLKFSPSLAKKKFNFELKEGMPKPEIWAYYADYDWVVFCQLFGTMMDLPKDFPMYCRDIKQLCDDLGNPELPKQDKGEHNAIADARWNKTAYEFLRSLDKKQ
jgi:hypothetical protein